MYDRQNLTDHIDAKSAETVEIRRLPGGAIDHDFYRRRGRALHGGAVRFATRRLWGALKSVFGGSGARDERDYAEPRPLLPALPAE